MNWLSKVLKITYFPRLRAKRNWFTVLESQNQQALTWMAYELHETLLQLSSSSNAAVGIKAKGPFFAPSEHRRATYISHCSAISWHVWLEQGEQGRVLHAWLSNVILYLGLNSVNDYLILSARTVFTQPRSLENDRTIMQSHAVIKCMNRLHFSAP